MVGIVFGIVCVGAIFNAIRKYRKDKAEIALMNACTHTLHRSTHIHK